MRLHLNSLRKVQTIRQVCDGAAKFCDGAATKMDKTLSALGFSFAACVERSVHAKTQSLT